MRAVIYTLSRNDGNGASRELQAHADKEGFEVIGSFLEPPSRNVRANDSVLPVFYDCLDCCRREHADILLISTLSDLGDSSGEIVRIMDVLSHNRIPLYILDIDVNTIRLDGTQDPSGALVRKVLAQAALIDSDSFFRRMKAGRDRYVESGGRLGRPKGSGMTPEQTLEKYPGVASRFDEEKPATIDEIAAEEGVSPSTVKKVKTARMLWLDSDRLKKKIQEFYAMASDEEPSTPEEK